MKNYFVFKWNQLFCILCIGMLPWLSSCQKEKLSDDMDENTVSLSEIIENPTYINLPLIETKWKLVGFADDKKGEIKLAKPSEGNCYTLVFEEDGLMSGVTSTNGATGRFTLKDKEISISSFGALTEINELYDVNRYVEAMRKVYAFEMTKRGLALKFDQYFYLLFIPVE